MAEPFSISRASLRSFPGLPELVMFLQFANIANPNPGLGEAAVMLQRAWNEDPQSLPFAPYIKAHALVSLVQKGLHYHELEHSIDKVSLVD